MPSRIRELGPIKVDTLNLAWGLYEEIKKSPDVACVVYGMLPALIMEAFTRNLKEKIPDSFYEPGDPLTEYNGKYFRESIVHDVTSQILKFAKEDKLLQA